MSRTASLARAKEVAKLFVTSSSIDMISKDDSDGDRDLRMEAHKRRLEVLEALRETALRVFR